MQQHRAVSQLHGKQFALTVQLYCFSDFTKGVKIDLAVLERDLSVVCVYFFTFVIKEGEEQHTVRINSSLSSLTSGLDVQLSFSNMVYVCVLDLT